MVLSFSEAAAQAVQGAACSLLALSDEGTQWINSAIGADGDFGNVAGALRKNVCNVSSPTGDYGPDDPPFTGGQCPGVEYDVSWVRRTNGAGQQAGTFTDDGPINLIDESFEEPDGEFTIRYRLVGATSEQVINGGINQQPPRSRYTLDVTPVRTDGLADDCGDPVVPIPDYTDYSETVSITYEDNSETEITEDIDITLGPLIVGIGGILYAPVTVGTGDITLNGTLKLAPEVSVDLFPDGLFGGGGNTDNPAPSPGEPDPTPETPDDRRRIIGAIVTVTNFDEDIAKVTQVAQGDSPDIFVPRTGNISFYIDTPGGQAWTEPKPLRNIREYVPCPAREGAVDVAVTSGTGFTLAVTPVYADLAVI